MPRLTLTSADAPPEDSPRRDDGPAGPLLRRWPRSHTLRNAVCLCAVLALGAALAGKPEGLALYQQGQYVRALEELKWAAIDGDPEAQTVLGTMYLRGQGTERNAAQAAYWFQQAASQGYAAAERNLGELYLAGSSLPQDDGLARYWTQQAAEQGEAQAQVTLGRLLLDGRGGPQDAQGALPWFQRAADQNSADGQYQLAQLYERGQGVPQDKALALRWYRLAAAAGHKAATDALQRLTALPAGTPPQISAPTVASAAAPQLPPSLPFTKKKRVALLIAEQTYQDGSLNLTGPANDARLIQASLVRDGFTVTLKTDLSQAQMNRDISSFLAGVDRNTVSLLYYSGHGVEIGGANYLVPSDFRLRPGMTATEAQAQGVDIAAFYARMSAEAEGSLNITILDACRNNPFSARGLKGLSAGGLKAVGLPGGSGDDTIETFTAYAAASGQVAQDGVQNSPYATVLARQMLVPGQVLEVMFRNVRQEVARLTANQQIPTSSSNISSEFIFMPVK